METFSPVKIDSKSRPIDLDLNVYYNGFEACESGHKWGPLVRDHFVLHIIESGYGIFEIKGHRWILEKGQGFLIWPGIKSCYWADIKKPWNYHWIGFNGVKAETLLIATGLLAESPIFSTGKFLQEIIDCFKVIEQTPSPTGLSKIFSETAVLYKIFSIISKVSGLAPRDSVQTSKKEQHIRHAIGFMERNYSRNMSIDELSKHVGLDRTHLTHIFRQVMNISPTDYLIELRIRKGCELLATRRDLSIKEISFSVGYRDPLFFSKTFRKLKGMPPVEFRKRIQKS